VLHATGVEVPSLEYVTSVPSALTTTSAVHVRQRDFTQNINFEIYKDRLAHVSGPNGPTLVCRL